jgi:hypothetical protein
MIIDGKQWGNTDSEATLFHQVEAERHWWACGSWKIPSREEDLRHRRLLPQAEFETFHSRHHHIEYWLLGNVVGFNMDDHLKGDSEVSETE